MIDSVLGYGPSESYYFQLYPVNLVLLQEPVPSAEIKYKFSIYKGMQKFDQNKIMSDSNFIETNGSYVMPFRGCQLNFYLPSYSKGRKILFNLKLAEKDANEQLQLGGVDVDPANYIQEFKNNGTTRFQERIDISEQFSLEFQVYIQKSRFGLEKIVKSFKSQRTIKSPVRQARSPIQQARSQVKSPVVQRKQQSNTNQQPAHSVSQSVKSRSRVSKQPEPVQQKKENLAVRQRQKEKSQKSQTINEPMIKSKQVKRLSGRMQQSGHGEVHSELLQKKVDDSWKNHLSLVLFTIVGMLTIYWTMHPNSKI